MAKLKNKSSEDGGISVKLGEISLVSNRSYDTLEKLSHIAQDLLRKNQKYLQRVKLDSALGVG